MIGLKNLVPETGSLIYLITSSKSALLWTKSILFVFMQIELLEAEVLNLQPARSTQAAPRRHSIQSGVKHLMYSLIISSVK